MAFLENSIDKLRDLVDSVDREGVSYRSLQSGLEQLEQGDVSASTDITVMVKIGDRTYQSDNPTGEGVADILADAAATSGDRIVKLWQEIYKVAYEAKQHCEAAAARVADVAQPSTNSPTKTEPVSMQGK